MPAPFYHWDGRKARQVQTEAEANMQELTHEEFALLDGEFKHALENDCVKPEMRCWVSPDGEKRMAIVSPTIKTEWPE